MRTECRCVSCAACKGTGNVEIPTNGYPEWELETCEECRGSGISEKCQACQDDEDAEEENP